MPSVLPDILDRIVRQKREELSSAAADWRTLEVAGLQHAAARRDFPTALRSNPPSIIAEIKKASPSKGLLAGNFDPEQRAREYEQGGAAAISVLTDRQFFQGQLADLEQARAAVHIPVLRKDFTLDERHVIEAAAHGADAILLIAAILSLSELRALREAASRFQMAALVEVHDLPELDRALESGAGIIGVNNRDLRSFETNLQISFDLAARMPREITKVSESGIVNARQVRELMDAGFHAFLVGEHLMRTADPSAELRALRMVGGGSCS